MVATPDKFDWVEGDVKSACAVIASVKLAADPAAPSVLQNPYVQNTALGAGLGGLLGAGRALWRGHRRPGRILQDALTGGSLGGLAGLGGTAAYDLATRNPAAVDVKQPSPESVAMNAQRDKLLKQFNRLGGSISPSDPFVRLVDKQVQSGKWDPDALQAAAKAQLPDAGPGTLEKMWGDLGDTVHSTWSSDRGTLPENAANLVRPLGFGQATEYGTHPVRAAGLGGASLLSGATAYGAARALQNNMAARSLVSSSPDLKKPEWAKSLTAGSPQAKAMAGLSNPTGFSGPTWLGGLRTGGGSLGRSEVKSLLAANNKLPRRLLPGAAGLLGAAVPLIVGQSQRSPIEQALEAAGIRTSK